MASLTPEQQVVTSIIPLLNTTSHKGQNGRIGIIGGCREYTGAPYFAAISAMRVGCDIAHVFCTSDAAGVIKTYSPDLIVHPVLGSATASDEISMVLPKLHSLVIGPGLGREETIFHTIGVVIERAKEMQLPLVLDADSLHYVSSHPEVICGYEKAVLTPNAVEFSRLYKSVMSVDPDSFNQRESVKQLALKLGKVTIVRKGAEDIISNGTTLVTCTEVGSPRRCGGQGDLLCGALGVFITWAYMAYANVEKQSNLSPIGASVVAGLGACMLTRKCSMLAFQKFSRSMITSDMIKEIKSAFKVLFPVD